MALARGARAVVGDDDECAGDSGAPQLLAERRGGPMIGGMSGENDDQPMHDPALMSASRMSDGVIASVEETHYHHWGDGQCPHPACVAARAARLLPVVLPLYDQFLLLWHNVLDARDALELAAPGQEWREAVTTYTLALAPFYQFTRETCELAAQRKAQQRHPFDGP